MANTLVFQRSYFTNKIGEQYDEQENGACLTLQYLINGKEVRFIILKIDLDCMNRKTNTIMIRQVKDEVENWVTVGNNVQMSVNDLWFIDMTTLKSVHSSKAYDYVDDKDKPIPGTDPGEYEQKPVLKENLINEVDFMIDANEHFFAIVLQQAKTKVDSLY